MNFTTFWTKLAILEKSITIASPVSLTVKAAYWGAPSQAAGGIPDLPCIINDYTEADRALGFGLRSQGPRVNVQCLVARAGVEDDKSAINATALWFAAKDAFDGNTTITGTVSLAWLKGASPTVPVILQHAGQLYIGFNAVLEIQDVEAFTFG